MADGHSLLVICKGASELLAGVSGLLYTVG